MNDKTEQLLKKLGVPAQTLADLKDEEKVKDLNVDEIEGGVMSNLKEVLKNDQAFMSEIEKGTRASVLSSKESKLKKAFAFLNLSEEDFAGLPKEKLFDETIKLMATKAEELSKKAKGSGDKDQEIENLNGQIRDLKEAKRVLEEETIPGIKATVDTERNAMLLDASLAKELGTHKLMIDKDFAFASVSNSIKSKYDLRREADGSIKILEKGKEVEAFDENKQKITLSGLVKATVEAANIVQKSNAGAGGGSGAGAGVGSGAGGGTGGAQEGNTPLPGLAAAKAHAEKMKGTGSGGE